MTPGLICPNMKKTSLKSVLSSLETGETEIRVPEETAARAQKGAGAHDAAGKLKQQE